MALRIRSWIPRWGTRILGTGLFANGIFERLSARRALRHWRGLADQAATASLRDLRRMKAQASQIRGEIDRLVHSAEARLAGIHSAIPRPDLAEWVWRPDVWSAPVRPSAQAPAESGSAIGADAKLFHDSAAREIVLRQVRNPREDDGAPWALRFDVYRFEGSYLSLAIELPPSAVREFRPDHVLQLDTSIEAERPVEIFARLNIRHGPNTEQIVRELPFGEARVATEFDLAHSRLNQSRLERAWIDLILGRPEMNQLTLRDLTLSRRPRANL